VTYESGRIELLASTVKSHKHGPILCEMVNNIVNGVRAEKIHRIDVDFVMNETNLDTLLGRAAHIKFLDNETLMRSLVYRFSDLLE